MSIRSATTTNIQQFGVIRSLIKTFSEFTQNSSLHGYNYLTNKEKTFFEKLFWWLVQLTALGSVMFLVTFSWNQFMDDPTVTSLETASYPITNIPFPGVSVCNLNKISQSRAKEYAEELGRKTNRSKTELLEEIKLLGKLYDFDMANSEQDFVTFQSILDTYDKDPYTGRFEPDKRLKKLTKPCDQLITNCSWAGEKHRCSDLFLFTTTMDGFCCVFNYVPPILQKQTKKDDNEIKPMFSSDPGPDYGLSVTITSNLSDYFYTPVASEGANLHIFNSLEFPDTTSGGLVERIIPIGAEIFVRLSATSFYAIPDVKNYAIGKRKCLFEDEGKNLHENYSYSDCLVDCRLKSIAALCQCIPFNFIDALGGQKYPQCVLTDIPCLNKYQEKWRKVYPFGYEGDDMEPEKQDSLFCDHCIPACSNTIYNVRNDNSGNAVYALPKYCIGVVWD